MPVEQFQRPAEALDGIVMPAGRFVDLGQLMLEFDDVRVPSPNTSRTIWRACSKASRAAVHW